MVLFREGADGLAVEDAEVLINRVNPRGLLRLLEDLVNIRDTDGLVHPLVGLIEVVKLWGCTGHL